MNIFFGTKIHMFLSILIVLGIVETVVMPPVFDKESFHIEQLNPELNKQVEHVNLSLRF